MTGTAGGALDPAAAARTWDHPAVRWDGGSAATTAARATGIVLAHLLTRPTVRGLDHVPATGAVVLVVNHSSILDGPLVYALLRRPVAFLVKREAYVGVAGRLLTRLGQIPVRRGTVEREPIRAALAVLAAGGAVGIFPEGTRTRGAVAQVERGAGYLAVRSGAPIVPVACLGTDRVLPRGRWLPRPLRPVTIAFGAPITVGHAAGVPSRSVVSAASEQVRGALVAHLAATRMG